LGPIGGRRVLDLCAAPGGKTLQLAAAGAQVTALDRSDRRLDRLRQNLRRTGLEADIVFADATEWQPPAPFDAVLIDAPCSATGTIRRHPELPWRRGADDLAALMALQDRLLARAADFVVPGGTVVFCTCSLLPEEGEARVAAADARLQRRPLGAGEIDAGLLTRAGDLRTLPSFWPEQGGMDGFYAARLVRVIGA
jgi:16S rRNA (cytosine967-C5)-methyltransferase